MKRIGARQPICLSKTKKFDKENTVGPLQKSSSKIHFAYDITQFHESLNWRNSELNKNNKFTEPLSANKRILNDSTNFIVNTMRDLKQFAGKQNSKENGCKDLGVTAPLKERLQFSKDFRQMKSLHKTSTCIKPAIVSNESLRYDVKNESKKDSGLTYVILKPKREIMENTEMRLDDLQAKKSQSIQYKDSATINANIQFEEKMQFMKKAYQNKICEVIIQNQKLESNIKHLQLKIQTQQKEKQQILCRMEAIQKQFAELMNENQEIRSIDNQISQLGATQEKCFLSCQTQTEIQEQNVRKSQRYSALSYQSQSARNSLEIANQNWFTKAKTFKSELEWQKVHSTNVESELKVSLENKEIEWRQKYERLQKQFDTLNDKFVSKCMQVRDKQNLLSRFLGSK